MDNLFTTGQVAKRLGTSRWRIHRAVQRGVVRPRQTGGGHLRFRPAQVAVLERQLGAAPTIQGFNREEVLTAAALLRRPLGLRSARAVARAAGISPTSAARSLRRLEQRGLVRHRRRHVVLGVSTDTQVWEADLRNPRWASLAPELASVIFPHKPVDPDSRVPGWLRHLFWNADVRRLDLENDAAYIAGRILASEDALGHAWAAAALPAEAFRHAARMRGLAARRAALATNLAGGG